MESRTTNVIILMGVSGCGKTTLATELSHYYGQPMIEADDFHPEANKQKLSSGVPLDDTDRWPWLTDLGYAIARRKETMVVATCSALKQSYRVHLANTIHQASASGTSKIAFVYLKVPYSDLVQRLDLRTNHFMPRSLLDSQLSTLEDPSSDDRNGLYSVFTLPTSSHSDRVHEVLTLLKEWGCKVSPSPC